MPSGGQAFPPPAPRRGVTAPGGPACIVARWLPPFRRHRARLGTAHRGAAHSCDHTVGCRCPPGTALAYTHMAADLEWSTQERTARRGLHSRDVSSTPLAHHARGTLTNNVSSPNSLAAAACIPGITCA